MQTLNNNQVTLKVTDFNNWLNQCTVKEDNHSTMLYVYDHEGIEVLSIDEATDNCKFIEDLYYNDTTYIITDSKRELIYNYAKSYSTNRDFDNENHNHYQLLNLYR